MTRTPRILKYVLAFLTFLTFHGVSSGLTLYDVVISLSDRQRVINQQIQVSTYLSNQNYDPDADLPDDFPIDWLGAGTNPTQSGVDGLDIGGKIALLNQAVAEFDRLKFAFLNSSPGEFDSGATVGALKPHTSGDFQPLPRATPENYNELLRLLAQRVRALRLIQWPAAFRQKTLTDRTNVGEVVVYDDLQDEDNNDDYEPRVEIRDQDDAVLESVTWKPESIGAGNLHVEISEPSTSVTPYFDSQIHVYGNYLEYDSGVEEITAPLRYQRSELSVTYPEEARVSATAPGGAGTQIDGTVYILRRSHWHQIDIDGASMKFEENQAGYVVEGSGNSGGVSLFGNPPTATVNGAWVTTREDGIILNQKFVEGGYQYKEAWTFPYDDPGHSDDYDHSYEKNWKVGCAFYSVFKPTFTRGVDATGMREKLESSARVLADNTADGALLLHPRPGLLFGIDLGPGLMGAGNGYISGGSMESDLYYGYYDYYGWYWDGWNSMARFDSSYSLQLAGSCSDYHVVYENNRSNRSQSLPADSMGWPHTDSGDVTQYDTDILYLAWDSPRLKQVAGRDLVADIDYNSSHYGGYTVKVYRRPTGSTPPTPGQALSTSGMTLIRTWTFSHPGAGTTAHPTDAEKLQATGNGGEKYEILANHIAPYRSIGYENWYYGYGYDWWWWTEGAWSWTLKLSQGTTEKLRKDIEITTTKDEGDSFVWDVALRESLDGQIISSLSSMTLDPFSGQFPADWEITSAGKTITGSATLGDYYDRATRYGTLPTAVSVSFDGIQPDVDSEWNASGLLTSIEQGSWSTGGTMDGDAFKQTHKLNNSTVRTDWIELLDGGKKVKTYSAPDGTVDSKSGSSVAWSEVEYGTATNGLPGLPFIVKNSDGSGSTYGWNASGDGSYILTLEEGLLSGSSVSRRVKILSDINAGGHPNKIEFFATNGGSLRTGGTVFSNFTAWGMPKTGTDHNSGLASAWDYANNLSRLSTHTGSLGVVSNFSGYDVLGRPGTVSTNGISAANTYTAFSTSSTITGSATGTIAETRDNLGRLTSSNTTWNGVTDNLTVTPDTSPVGVERQSFLGTYNATLRQDDGTLAATSGPILPFGGTEGASLTVDNGLLKSTAELGNQSATFQTTWTDAWGRVRKTTAPTASGNGTTDYLYGDATSSLKRVRITEPTGRKTITESDPYNSSGAITRSGIDVNGNGELGASDRYVESITKVSGGNIVTTLKLTEDGGLREILSTEWTPSSNKTVTTINGSEETITRTPNYTTKTVSTTSTKGWARSESFNNLGLTTSSDLSGGGVPAATLTPVWGADGSLSEVAFTVGGATHSATLNNDGTLASLNAPGRGNILGSHTISGGVETLTVDGTTITQKLDGTQTATSGTDVIGKTDTLAVSGSGFQQTIHPAVGADTTSSLNAAGAPTSKNYAAGTGEVYGYENGLLHTVSLARGGSLEFGYSNDGAKDLTTAAWPAVSSGAFSAAAIVQGYGYDRAGRMDEIGDASGVRAIAYQNGRANETVWNSGALAGYKIVRSLDGSGRDTGFTLYRGNTVIHSAAKAPNGTSGEISGISSGNLTATYGRDSARNITSITRNSVTQTWPRTSGRITAAGSSVSGAPAFSYTSFDTKGRRLNCTTAGGAWTYQYTNGQITSATHPTLGSFSYSFDGIGRRTDKGSANTSDLLNRTLAWTHSQNKTLKVTAAPAARVWVNGTEIPGFTGNYNYSVPSPGSSGGWVAWNTLAVLEGEGDPGANADAKAEQSGAVWVPPASESFTFDAAGNRESSALWDFGWDAKNQLVRARTKNHTSAAQGFDVTHAYDAEGRRFSKKVNRYQNGVIAEQKQTTFIWDGNDLIYEREQLPSGLTTLERKYVWGPDIAGGNAGGAGGLLLILETKGNVTTALYPLYDGTGHVTALADSSGALQATYHYGPFGELIHATGPHAQSNPFRYATKYFDAETGLYYFGKRFLDPITGQWLSREPLGESESLNLYSYCHNDPVNRVDRLGLDEVTVTDGNARYNFVDEVNGARGGWLKKTLDYVFLAKFDGSERKFTGSVGLGPVSGGMVSLPGGASIPLSDLQTMADGRAMGHLGQAERMRLLTGDINGWLSRNEGAGGSKIVGTLDKIISSPFQALAGPDSLTILTGIADKHDGFSFGVDLGSRNYARGIHLGTEIDDGIQIASIPLLLNPKNAGTLVRGARALEVGGGLTISASRPFATMGKVGGALSGRQAGLLDLLSTARSSTLVRKADVSLGDLAALTAHTGDEFGIFTLGSRRMVYRGTSTNLGLSEMQIYEHALGGWKFSGHTHPGISRTVLGPSSGDRNVLQLFEEMGTQRRSSILNSSGDFQLFSPSLFDDSFGF